MTDERRRTTDDGRPMTVGGLRSSVLGLFLRSSVILLRSSVLRPPSFFCLKLIERRNYLKPDDPVMIQAYEQLNYEFAKLSAFISSLK